MEALEGVFEGKASAALVDGLEEFRFEGELRDLNLAALPIEIPEPAHGLVSGTLCVGGSVDRPDGSLELIWEGTGSSPVLDMLRVHADLSDGVLSVATEDSKTLAGTTVVDATIPLGDLPLPDWMWLGAPGGPVVAHLRSDGFRSGPLTDALDIQTYGVEMAADLQADVTWDPIEAGLPHAEVVARELRFHLPSGDLVAESPLIATYHQGRLEVAPVVVVGLDSRIEVEAIFDPATDEVAGRVRSLISPELARLMPIPLRVRGPLMVSTDFQIPASTAASFETWRAVFEIDHGDGTLVMRDPPLEIRGMRVAARLRDGHLDITDGEAEVNRGTVVLGGGWNPENGQGIILGLENVTLYLDGILTKWDGHLAIEPRAGVLAHVGGDLTLTAGLWDETFSFASAVLGGGDLGLAADDPLHDISLDISVRGRAGIRVHNNLGRFDASWDTLRIGGTAAAPRIRGEVRIAPGGVIALGGREVVVRRGGLEFTGDPAVDPILEIVPESDMTLLSSDEEGSLDFDPTLMATRGLAQGLSSALGFENETLQPAEIAGQTERDPSVNFMVGQRLNRYLALFISANLTDVRDRMSMLQAWNFRGLRGLVLQIYQETLDDNAGGTIMQRFSWGATTPQLSRPEIHRLRLEGDWPMSKRFLKNATRLRRGQPFDPFLLFVASVRMERALAENGYQNSRVTAFQEGDERSPTLVFYCEPGAPQFVQFLGEPPPRPIRAEVTAMYRQPPLEASSLAEMAALVKRYFAMDGFPDAEVSIERLGDLILVNADPRAGSHVERAFLRWIACRHCFQARPATRIERGCRRGIEATRLGGAITRAAVGQSRVSRCPGRKRRFDPTGRRDG